MSRVSKFESKHIVENICFSKWQFCLPKRRGWVLCQSWSVECTVTPWYCRESSRGQRQPTRWCTSTSPPKHATLIGGPRAALLSSPCQRGAATIARPSCAFDPCFCRDGTFGPFRPDVGKPSSLRTAESHNAYTMKQDAESHLKYPITIIQFYSNNYKIQ